eukprot:GFUD01031153.1.p1 GENE.GFUD01031153.1~~GFUD01031153.1.p1  ORF type:complete len:419 (+),score=50.13 GFUD01031153.1:62-1318(+)
MGYLNRYLALCLLIAVFMDHVKGHEGLHADVAGDNASYDDYASNALLTEEEKKSIFLLDRIQAKIGTMTEDEKVELVEKIANYRDRFTKTLAKVETIPGMYGLNVAKLRATLGIPGTEGDVEETHEDFEDLFESISAENAREDVGEDIAQDLSFLARNAGTVSNQKDGKKKTIDDLYSHMTKLANLVMISIMSTNQMLSKRFPPQFGPGKYGFPIPNQPIRRQPSRPVRPQKPVSPSNQEFDDMQNIFSQMPPEFHEAMMNTNFDKKKRKRRQAEFTEPPPVVPEYADSPPANQEYTEAPQPTHTYNDWYYQQYLPYLQHYQAQVAEYERQMREYRWRTFQASIPSNPFGSDKSFSKVIGNKFYKYSKTAYANDLHERAKGLDLGSATSAWRLSQKNACEDDGDIWDSDTNVCAPGTD